jgi:hypothetical protein
MRDLPLLPFVGADFSNMASKPPKAATIAETTWSAASHTLLDRRGSQCRWREIANASTFYLYEHEHWKIEFDKPEGKRLATDI